MHGKTTQLDLKKKGYYLFEWLNLFIFLALLRRLLTSKMFFCTMTYHVTVFCKGFIKVYENGHYFRSQLVILDLLSSE